MAFQEAFQIAEEDFQQKVEDGQGKKRNHNKLDSVRVSNGHVVSGLGMGNLSVNHFRSILGEIDANVDPTLPLNFFPRTLLIEDANFMIRLITK
ncbi:hypothetical protein OSB04_019468 [Centaurea solstitialis]|uniref:Uncharacterized protein n=1 Tax=Centaurea solstitialis TaxID=347529 RepID=A0AA38T2P0_9ASTR|nr:hypothetical protein OSB04_019468 [Centaurea solstitialis]